jgi:hypothetical protein
VIIMNPNFHLAALAGLVTDAWAVPASAKIDRLARPEFDALLWRRSFA